MRITIYLIGGIGIIGLGIIGCLPRQTTCKCYCNSEPTEASSLDTGGPDPGLKIPAIYENRPAVDDTDTEAPSSTDEEALNKPASPRSSEPYTEADCSDELRLKDPQMTLLVRRRLQQTHGPIKVRDVATWTELSNEFGNGAAPITDLSGIECFSALEKLTITKGRLVDLTPISRLSSLKEIELTNTGVREIKALEKLPKLTKLVLSKNQITDTAQFAKLIQLESLTLDNNQISDIAPLVKLSRLQWLSLAGNRITKAGALSKMIQLKGINLDKNQVRDIRFVKNLKNLVSFSLSDNGITDLRPLAGALPELKQLHLRDNPIADFTPLTYTLGSGVLDISNTGINCTENKSILETLSIRWTEMYIDCPEFWTGV
jgi:Leucine-rich repeat (LRR) protein